MAEDARQSTRKRVQLWSVQWQGDARYYRPIQNLSMGGLFVHTDVIFPVGTELEIELRLPEEALRASGVVVHTGGGNGIAFVELAANEAQRLRSYLDSV